jgi:hypothetical protein
MLTKPVKITKVTSMMPNLMNEISHEGEPSAKVKVAQILVTMDKSLNVGRKSLIIRSKPLMTIPKLRKTIRILFVNWRRLDFRSNKNIRVFYTVGESIVHNYNQPLFLLVVFHHDAEGDLRQGDSKVYCNLSHVSRVE